MIMFNFNFKASFLLLVILCISFPFALHKLKNPAVNLKSKVSIHECIYRGKHQHSKIGNFKINFIENSAADCINPNHPSIHMIAYGNHNAWLHVVHTDAIEPYTNKPNWTFIDAHESIFPFYTFGDDFYDAPYWNSSLLTKHLHFWRGHAYPVILDHTNKKVKKWKEGIEWGFTWSLFGFSPTAILPRLITFEEQLIDQEILKKAFIENGFLIIE